MTHCIILFWKQTEVVYSFLNIEADLYVIRNLKVQLGGTDCISQCLFLVLHASLFRLFVFVVEGLVGRAAFWRQVS